MRNWNRRINGLVWKRENSVTVALTCLRNRFKIEPPTPPLGRLLFSFIMLLRDNYPRTLATNFIPHDFMLFLVFNKLFRVNVVNKQIIDQFLIPL